MVWIYSHFKVKTDKSLGHIYQSFQWIFVKKTLESLKYLIFFFLLCKGNCWYFLKRLMQEDKLSLRLWKKWENTKWKRKSYVDNRSYKLLKNTLSNHIGIIEILCETFFFLEKNVKCQNWHKKKKCRPLSGPRVLENLGLAIESISKTAHSRHIRGKF